MTKKDIREYLASIGRKGGKKSGEARMEKLTPEQRSEIARKAVTARWAKEKEQEGKPRKLAAKKSTATKKTRKAMAKRAPAMKRAAKSISSRIRVYPSEPLDNPAPPNKKPNPEN